MVQKTLSGFDQENGNDNTEDNETQEYEPVGFTPSERNRHLDQIQNDIVDIDGVEDVGWIAEPNYLDDAQFNIVIESEKTLDRNYRIGKDLRDLNSDIKSVLNDHEDKISSDFITFRSPKYVDTDEYESNLYEVDLMML